jgi:hypothetical protein
LFVNIGIFYSCVNEKKGGHENPPSPLATIMQLS